MGQTYVRIYMTDCRSGALSLLGIFGANRNIQGGYGLVSVPLLFVGR